jgi:serralysin
MALTMAEAYARLNLSADLLPVGVSNRPGTRITPTHITIHNTDNSGRGADALAHARYMRGADARRRRVSWHYTVDDARCVKSLPTNEKGWHAGGGNSKSIGIEICQQAGIDQEAAYDRAALLTAVLIEALGIAVEMVVTHQHWTGKYCPRKLLDTFGSITPFRRRVAEYVEELRAGAVGDAMMALPPDLPPLVDEAFAGDLTEADLSADLSALDEADLLLGRLYRENARLRRHAAPGSPGEVGGDDTYEADCGGTPLPVVGDDGGVGGGEVAGRDDITDADIERIANEFSEDEIAGMYVCTEMPVPPEQFGDALNAAANENPENVAPPPATFSLSAAVAALPGPAIAVVARKLWRPGRTLRVRFMESGDGYPDIPDVVKDRIIYYANRWIEDADVNLEFVFGTDAADAEIRVSNRLDGTSWSYIGTDALVRPRNEPTMNYGWLRPNTTETEFERVIVHEFGHALGAIHEHQNPRAEIPWDRAKVYAYYRRTNGWDRRTVDVNIFQRYSTLTTNSSQYDRLSIMHYAIPRELLTDPRFAVGWNTRLSATDRAFMRQQYSGRRYP